MNKAEIEYKKPLESAEKINHLIARRWLGDLCLLMGRFEKSKNQFKLGVELAKELGEMRWESTFHESGGYMHLVSGNLEQALAEFDKVWKIAVQDELLDDQRSALFWKGLSNLKMKSLNEAQKLANELKELIQEGTNEKEMRHYYLLMAIFEFERENPVTAIEYLEKALSLLPSEYSAARNKHALFFGHLASVYYKTGDLEKAREGYESIIRLTAGRARFGDIYAKSFYMLGKIYEQQGDIAKSIEHHEKFLDLWKDADPGIAEVEDAREKLAGLKEPS
jgi:tetratricopeptide (TPR) repeat protein